MSVNHALYATALWIGDGNSKSFSLDLKSDPFWFLSDGSTDTAHVVSPQNFDWRDVINAMQTQNPANSAFAVSFARGVVTITLADNVPAPGQGTQVNFPFILLIT
jgi:hypothetical protein